MSRSKRIAGFIALVIAMFMGTLDSTIVNIAIPDIMKYFNATLNDVSWISTIYVLGLSVFMITASKLADQFGRKKIMLIGLALFGASSALCGLSGSLLFLIAMRFIQGIGGAIITPIVVPMCLEIFGKEKTRSVAAVIGAITAAAAAGGPPIGGLIVEYVNWQTIFFINIPFSIVSILLTVLFIDETYDETISKRIDWLGMLLLTSTLFLLTFALLKGSDYGWTSATIISMFAGSAVSLILFLIVESRVKAPLVELSLFHEFTFTASSICYLITGFGIVAPILIFNYFLQNVVEYSALKAGLIVMAVSLTVIIAMPLGNAIASKFGARPVNFAGVFFMGVGALLLSQLTVSTSIPAMVSYMIVCGIGLGFSCQSLVSSIKYLPIQKVGMGSGIVNAARQIGTCIGIALLVSILNTNVTAAKTDIITNAVDTIQKANIEEPVKVVIIDDINKYIASIGDNNNTVKNQELEDNLESDVKSALTSLTTARRPESEVLSQLYDGAEDLTDGAKQVTDGQNTLNDGLKSMDTGLDKLQDGSDSLVSGLASLDDGLSQAVDGSERIESEGGEGLSALSSGIEKLNNGAQQLLSQFSAGDKGTQTVCDGISAVSAGAQNLSSGINSYVSSVNNTIYLMIKYDPSSAMLLEGYQNSLANAKTAYANSDKSEKEKYAAQIQALQNLVNLYTAGTDSSVITEAQFEARLISLSQENETGGNIVANGQKITGGAASISDAIQKIAALFSDGGTFKSAFEQLAQGLDKLNRSTDKLDTLKKRYGQHIRRSFTT